MTNLLHIPSAAQELAPGDLLSTDATHEQRVRVTDGILYVRRDDYEAVLVAGDSITLSAGEPRRAWNAGDETARVVVSEAGAQLPRAA
jgi:quercetin dioxygenase-like cupin family protein